MRSFVISSLLVVACGGGDPEQKPCRDGFERDDAGGCVPVSDSDADADSDADSI